MESSARAFRIADRLIGEGAAVFVIAEIGNNHNGSVSLAREMISAAHEAGADAVKFQLRDPRSYNTRNPYSDDLGAQYDLALWQRFGLQAEAIIELCEFAQKLGVVGFCTPSDLPSAERLLQARLPAIKVASSDLTDHALLTRLAQQSSPLIVSTGMSHEDEIKTALGLLDAGRAPYALMHTIASYPAPYDTLQLGMIDRLRQWSGRPVGYSGHELGWHVPLAAVARGAKLIEKHFTLTPGAEGRDHRLSLTPQELRSMILAIRDIESALATGPVRQLQRGEFINRETLAKSLVTVRELSAGEKISEEMLTTARPGHGLAPHRKSSLLGKTLTRSLPAGTTLQESDFQTDPPLQFAFPLVWGIPVRPHDFHELIHRFSPPLVEFHLSAHDLTIPAPHGFPPNGPQALVVHAPELFEQDHIIDLASEDAAHRSTSLAYLVRVRSYTLQLIKAAALHTAKIVVNVGGHSQATHRPQAWRPNGYARVAELLGELQHPQVEWLVQTMPPYPWHLGGRAHHNLFVDPAECRAFADRTGVKLCLDLSHAYLAARYLELDFSEYVAQVLPVSRHLHIADAAQEAEEGLQIGDGEIDFISLIRSLRSERGLSFVPEIWQGHIAQGQGFRLALERLMVFFHSDSATARPRSPL